jgi:hypothetical protein
MRQCTPKISAPMPSTASIRVTVRPSTSRIARGLASPSELLTARRSTSEIWRPSRRRVSTVVTRKPRPPNCISSRMTHWPGRVNAVLVVTTDSPVTAAAEVAVNKASSQEIGCVVIHGRRNSSVPAPTNSASATIRRSGIGRMRLRCGSSTSCVTSVRRGWLCTDEVMEGQPVRAAAYARRRQRACHPAPAGSRHRGRAAGEPGVGS